MRAAPVALCALCALAGLPALAGETDMTALTPAERAAFRTEMRAYLVAHPELIEEVFQAPTRSEYGDYAAADRQRFDENAEALYTPDPAYVTGPAQDAAAATIVAFIRYDCADCAPALADLRAMVAADPGLRLVVQDVPGAAERSARFALAALMLGGAPAYLDAQEALFAAPLQPGGAAALARRLGLDPDLMADTMRSATVSAALVRAGLLFERLELTDLPAFVVEDTMVQGYLPPVAMGQIIAAQRRDNR